MKVPLGWLEDYVDITLPVEALCERLTLAGLEVGAVERIGDWWDRERILVGEIQKVSPHPDADRLVLIDVDYGGGELETCVTGAPNLFPYKGAGPVRLKIAFAMEGAELYDGHKPGFVKTQLKRTRIRGVPSRAMACSEKELGISEEHEGIMILPQDAPVGRALADYLGDTVLDLDLTPNLARCFSMVGVAREVAALTEAQMRYPDTSWCTGGPAASELAQVVIEDEDLCARYIATVIRDVEPGLSPQWMQDRVRRAGMRPISVVVDITNYVMLEWGQPLHAFDYDKLVARAGGKAPTIIVRRARPGEAMMTLDGVDRVFDADTLLICDTAGPIAVAGVMGGYETEIDEDTRNILLESANFDYVSIRRTTQALRLPSEASGRFGRGIHPALAEPAARRASELMRTLGEGTIAQGMVDSYPRRPKPVTIELAAAEVERNMGVRFSPDELSETLGRLEFVCEPLDADSIRVVVPDHRMDCRYPADLIEDIARIYGYDRIPITELADRLPPQRSNRRLELEEGVRDILVALGLQDTLTYSLTSFEREAALDPERETTDLNAEAYVRITNPITQDRSVMRRSLLPTLLEVAASNLRFRDRVEVFEIGKVFLAQEDQDLPSEPQRLAIVVTGPRDGRHWLSLGGPELDFFDLKGVVEALAERLHISGLAFEEAQHRSFQPGRTALLRAGGAELGHLGEVHPDVRRSIGLPERRVVAAELDLDALLAQAPMSWFVESVSAYPAVLQDLAVVVDEDVPASTVHDAILRAGGFLLKKATLFDLYRGAPVPEGKKSLAFGLAFQAPDKTLRESQVAKQVKRILGSLRKQLGAELRG